MNFNVVVTSSFKKHGRRLSKKYPSLKLDIANLIKSLEKKPIQGESLGKDCFKIRMAISSKGKGKRGGSRIITSVKVTEHDVFLLSIYDKSEIESITDKELDKLLKMAGLL